jgi:hypothetical protein
MVRPVEVQCGRSGKQTPKPQPGCLRMKAMKGRMRRFRRRPRANHVSGVIARFFERQRLWLMAG